MSTICSKCEGRSKVTDSRFKQGTVIRRRRCKSCDHRWSTVETGIRNPEKRLGTLAKKRIAYTIRELENLIK